MEPREYAITARSRRAMRQLRIKARAIGWNTEPPLRWRLFIATHPNGGYTRFGKRALHSN